MDLHYKDTLQGEEKWVVNTFPYLRAIQNSRDLIGMDISDAIKLVEKRHRESYNWNLFTSAYEYNKRGGSDDSDSDHLTEEEGDDRERAQRRIWTKRNLKQTIGQSIHYDRKWLKIQIALEILQAGGFTKLDTTAKVKIRWDYIHHYCRKKEPIIRALFEVHKKEWKETLTPNEKVSLSKYVQHKLEKTLAVQLKATSERRVFYTIDPCYVPLGREVAEEEVPVFAEDEEEQFLNALYEETDELEI